MPSALVEIGFHTNKEDAAAMASKRFRIIATAGLRKGYDSFRKGQSCETFKVTGITDIETTFRKITMNMPYVGNPTFPIYMNIVDEDGEKMLVKSRLSKIPNTLAVSMLCNRQRPKTKFKAIVEDEDYALTQVSFVADCWL